MRIRFVVRNNDVLNREIEAKRAGFNHTLVDKINEYVVQLYDRVISKLNGSVLHRRSGKLIDSIRAVDATVYRQDMVGGYVTQDLRVAPHGAVQEHGGLNPYTMVPKKKFLVFLIGGKKVAFTTAAGKRREFQSGRKMIFARQVNRAVPLPKRSFMVSSLEEMRGEFTDGIGTIVRR